MKIKSGFTLLDLLISIVIISVLIVFFVAAKRQAASKNIAGTNTVFVTNAVSLEANLHKHTWGVWGVPAEWNVWLLKWTQSRTCTNCFIVEVRAFGPTQE